MRPILNSETLYDSKIPRWKRKNISHKYNISVTFLECARTISGRRFLHIFREIEKKKKFHRVHAEYDTFYTFINFSLLFCFSFTRRGSLSLICYGRAIRGFFFAYKTSVKSFLFLSCYILIKKTKKTAKMEEVDGDRYD